MSNQSYDRSDRVSQKLHEILGRLMLTELRDPRLQRVEITGVDVSPDIKHATVYWVMYGEEEEGEREAAAGGLERATGYLKREVAERLDTKYTPDLAFEYDESIERGRRIEELLEEADTPDDD